MDANSPSRRHARFGAFDFDLITGDLRKKGSRVRITAQPAQVLRVLIERSGEVVTRDDLRHLLWGDHVFVDFEHGLNAAVRRLRRALGDDADTPRFIETIPKLGYRFSGPVFLKDGDRGGDGRPSEPKGNSHQTWSCGQASAALSVAVLPFKGMGLGAEHRWLALALTDALITRLGSLRRFAVRPTSAVAHCVDSAPDLNALSRTLAVEALVDGHLQVCGTCVRATVQVVDGVTGAITWAQAFEDEIGQLFALQESIARAIADALIPRLESEDRQRLAKRHTNNVGAYQLYVEGRHFWTCWTAEAMRHAVQLFQHAIAKDPTFALAYAGLADALCLLGYQGMAVPRDAWPQAREAAIEALKLDDQIAEAHSALGMVNFTYEWQWAQAERHFRRALELNPNSSAAHAQYGNYLYVAGRFGDGLRHLRRAEELDPVAVIIKVMACNARFFMREFDEYLRATRELLTQCPGHPLVHAVVGLAYGALERYDEALAAFRAAVELTREGGVVAHLGRAYALAGRYEEAEAVIAELEGRSDHEYVPWYGIALIYAALRDRERAVSCLETAYESRDGWLVWANVDPLLDPLRTDQRIVDLLRRLGFPIR